MCSGKCDPPLRTKPGSILVFILDLDRSTETMRAVNSVLVSGADDVAVWVHVNGSNAEHTNRIMHSFANEDKVRVSRTDRNLGYAGGNNYILTTLKQSNADYQYILLLNNDARLEPDTIPKLRSVLTSNVDIGAVGPRIMQHEGNGIIASDGAGTCAWIMQQYFRNSGKQCENCPAPPPFAVPFISGACMLMRTDVFMKLDGFDEGFFAYFEDWDLCLRMHKIGYRCLHVADAVAWHVGSLTTGADSLLYHFLMTRNRYLMACKHLPLHIFVFVFLPYFMVSRIACKMLLLLLKKRIQGIKGILLALAWICAPAQSKPGFWPIP